MTDQSPGADEAGSDGTRPADGRRATPTIRRRGYLAAVGSLTAAGLAGCGLLESQRVGEPPLVEDRPDGIYVPTHVEGMQMADSGRDGRYRVALSYSFPHRFWRIVGSETSRVDPAESDAHLMFTAWDDETGRVLPAATQQVTVTRDGETLVDRSLWRMLSQNMSVHFGDNVSLSGDGTYDVALSVGPLGDRLVGDLAGAFQSAGSVDLSLEFSQGALDGLTFRELPDRQGERDAIEPMDMDMIPIASTPDPSALPGRGLGTAESADVQFAATAVSPPPAGVDGDGVYLAVSPRTRYNGYPLPGMSLAATVRTGEGTVFDDYLTAALGGDLGYHYGAVVPSIEDATEIELAPGPTVSVSRHEGYETAFFDLPSTTLEP